MFVWTCAVKITENKKNGQRCQRDLKEVSLPQMELDDLLKLPLHYNKKRFPIKWKKIGNLMKWPLNVVKGDKNKFMVIPMFTFQITL